MNYKPLLFKKSFLCITAFEILIILIIPINSYTREFDSNLLHLNRYLTLFKDSVTSNNNLPKTQSPLRDRSID